MKVAYRLLTLTSTLILTFAVLILLGPSSHAAAKDCFNPYAVGPTESWHSIANVCGIPFQALRDANASHIRHGDILYTGELLTLPEREPKPESGLTTYTVQPGDSWYRVAQDNALTFRDMRAFNPHLWKQRGEIIHPGDEFMLPLLLPAPPAEEPESSVAMDDTGCPVDLTLGAPYAAGGQVRVSGDAPISLYSAEGDMSEVVGEVASGTVLLVNTDPSCIDGWFWWQVTDTAQDLTGWAAANINDVPVLEPVQ